MARGEAELGGGGVGEDGAGEGWIPMSCSMQRSKRVGKGASRKMVKVAGVCSRRRRLVRLFGGSAAEGEDGVVAAEGGGEGGGFEAAEVGFAVALEELGDGGSGAGFEMGVEIEEVSSRGGRRGGGRRWTCPLP